jgi:uncharacterized NAD(P)/FAD-binding protein YdhS
VQKSSTKTPEDLMLELINATPSKHQGRNIDTDSTGAMEKTTTGALDSTSVIIVGGGLTGTLTAINLLHCTANQDVSITLLNPTAALGRGLAYRDNNNDLLLNVPAGNMSAFANAPSHFMEFCQCIDPSISAGSFMSRRLYGQYLERCLADAMAAHPGRLHTMVGEVHEVQALAQTNGFTVKLSSGQCLAAQHVVLALGHQPPRFPVPLGPQERDLVIDAWDFERMSRLPSDAPILILGTGHTAMDVLFHLTQRIRPSSVWMASRRGLLPEAHRLNPPPPLAPGALNPASFGEPPLRTRELMRRLQQEVARQVHRGLDWRDVFNQLRSHTPQLWHAMPLAERRRFLRHAVAFWDVHRHRLAPLAAKRLQSLLAAGTVEVLAARLLAVRKASHDRLELEFKPRGQKNTQTLSVAAIINCTGPSMGIGPDSQPLLQQLVQDRLLVPDPCGLGLQVNDRHQITNAQGNAVPGLWYVGPMLKARYWEATAAPELRVHAQQLAQHLATQMAAHSKSSTLTECQDRHFAHLTNR